jgi:hypothetical protein
LIVPIVLALTLQDFLIPTMRHIWLTNFARLALARLLIFDEKLRVKSGVGTPNSINFFLLMMQGILVLCDDGFKF